MAEKTTLSALLSNSDKSGKNLKNVEFKTMSELSKGDIPWKILVGGEFKSGKTRFTLSILNDLYFKEGLSKEQIKMVYIDLDNGLLPLIKQGLVPEELLDCIDYHMCEDFGDVLDATEKGLLMLREHVEKHGLKGAWLVVDNMGMAWEWARDFYSRAVYQKPMREMLIEAKKKALANAAAKGKKGGRIPGNPFDRMTDYAVINPLHNEWADSIKNSGLNFVWSALLKYEEKEVTGNQRTVVTKEEGQKHNGARVDFLIRKRVEEGNFYGELAGSRFTENLFHDVKDLNFTSFKEELYKIMDIESKKRERIWEKRESERPTAKKPKKEKKEEDVKNLKDDDVKKEKIEKKDVQEKEKEPKENKKGDDEWGAW